MRNFLIILLYIVVIALLNTLIGGLADQALASLFFAIILFTGKGDILIAGYNTASEEEKLYLTKRIRSITKATILAKETAKPSSV